jgi:hypothetical protein
MAKKVRQLFKMTLCLFVFSIGGTQTETPNCEFNEETPLILNESQSQAIRYTYRVTWNVSAHFHVVFLMFILAVYLGIRYALGKILSYLWSTKA